MKTLRLLFPQWQGGVNPNYYVGSHILNTIIPQNPKQETIEVPVDTSFDLDVPVIDGVSWKNELLKQNKLAKDILKIKQPDKVIVLGGDCSVEQAPFDYLHGKYPENTGIIWIDAHPDFSDPGDFSHEHAMVLGNLIGGGAKAFSDTVEHPFSYKDCMYAGLVADHLETWEVEHFKKFPINYASPEDLKDNNDKIINWIKENDYKQIIIHWDLDVLSPEDFYSLLCNEPYLGEVEYAVGKMTLKQIGKLIQDVSKVSEIVGLGITEFMPWDLIHFRETLNKLDIFNK